MRNGAFPGKPRTQAQVAISADAESWFLLGASPDLREQILACTDLRPGALRGSPMAGVVLASAELDHVLGLLVLRELQAFSVYGTGSVLRVLRETNSMFSTLNRAPSQVAWTSMVSSGSCRLRSASGEDVGLSCETIVLPEHYPAYFKPNGGPPLNDTVVGLILASDEGRSIAYFPNVSRVDENLANRLNQVDLLLFDGTFWNDDELLGMGIAPQNARQMGHLPVSGKDGSLCRLASLSKPRKLFIHINNVLAPI